MNSDQPRPSVFVIIVTYNGTQWIDKCLQQINNGSYPAQVIVVDNQSSDGTVSFIQTNYPDVEILAQTQNLGFGKANNIGIREALKRGADYVLLLNQDAYLGANTIELLIDAFEVQMDLTGIISPIHLAPDGSLDFGFADHIQRYAPNSSKEAIFAMKKGLFEVGFVNAACWMLSRKTIKTVGVFNPLFPHYGEDNDYINRVTFHQFKVKVLIEASVIHDRKQCHSASFTKMSGREEVAFLKHLSNINFTYKKAWSTSIDKLFRESFYYFFKLSWKRVIAIKLGFLNALGELRGVKQSRIESKKKGAYL